MKFLFNPLGKGSKRAQFFGRSFVILVISIAAAVGISVGFGGSPDLETMGMILAGTLGFAVAFAGAWVAFDIASKANAVVEEQSKWETTEAVFKTLKKSIGQILAMQSEMEALLRSIQSLAEAVDRLWTQAMRDTSKDRVALAAIVKKGTEEQKKDLLKSVEQASKKIQELLTSPLTLAALQATCREKNGLSQDQAVLTELSQVPRFLDRVQHRLRTSDYIRAEDARFGSVYDFLRGFTSEKSLALGIADLVDPDLWEASQVGVFSYACFLTDECRNAGDHEIKEPALWRALQIFAYTHEEAEAALAKLFPEYVYLEGDDRKRLLNSAPARAFCMSGQINDHVVAQSLDACRRITERIRILVGREDCKQHAPAALLASLNVAEDGREPALARAEKLWHSLPKNQHPSSSIRSVCSRLYERYICRELYLMMRPEWYRLSPYELYRCIYRCYHSYREEIKPKPDDFSLPRLFNTISQSVAAVLVHKELVDNLNSDAIAEQAARLIALAAQAGASDLLFRHPIPRGKAKDAQELFASLRIQLNRDIVDQVWRDLPADQRPSTDGILEQPSLRPLHVQLAAQACLELPESGGFEVWLGNQLRREVSGDMRGVLCLGQVRTLAGTASLAQDEKGFVVHCHDFPGVPGFLASSIKLRVDTADERPSPGTAVERSLRIEFCLPSFQEAGFANVWDEDIKLTEAMLVCSMLGYEKTDPHQHFIGEYNKQTQWGIDDLGWLRVILLEMRLLGRMYHALAGYPAK